MVVRNSCLRCECTGHFFSHARSEIIDAQPCHDERLPAETGYDGILGWDWQICKTQLPRILIVNKLVTRTRYKYIHTVAVGSTKVKVTPVGNTHLPVSRGCITVDHSTTRRRLSASFDLAILRLQLEHPYPSLPALRRGPLSVASITYHCCAEKLVIRRASPYRRATSAT